jgi:hypothetical protein
MVWAKEVTGVDLVEERLVELGFSRTSVIETLDRLRFPGRSRRSVSAGELLSVAQRVLSEARVGQMSDPRLALPPRAF